jgi:hypothetical protein
METSLLETSLNSSMLHRRPLSPHIKKLKNLSAKARLKLKPSGNELRLCKLN